MELIELVVWGIAIAAAMVFQVVQKRRQDRERAQRASQLPDGLFQPPQAPEPGPVYAPADGASGLGDSHWGRGTPTSAPVPALEEIHWGRGAPAPEVPTPVAPLPARGQHLPVPLSALHATVPVAAPAVRQAWHPTRRTRSAFFRSRADVRRAVVGMTVLGPCRALSPYGQDPDAGAAAPPPPARPMGRGQESAR